MPVAAVIRALGHLQFETLQSSVADADLERLLAVKKRLAQRRELLMPVQKKLGGLARTDEEARVLVRELADHLKDMMQLHRACQLFCGQLLAAPPGDSPHVPVSRWPAELLPACRTIDAVVCIPAVAESLLGENDDYWYNI